MRRIKSALRVAIAVATFVPASVLAQHGGRGATVPLPSSTALGAGALSAFPSSTSRGSAPAMGRISVRPGYVPNGSTYKGQINYWYANANHNGRREYRPLPSSYVAAPFYYPAFDWSGGTDYSVAPYDDSGAGYPPDPATDAMMMNQAALGQQVQRLTAQVNDLMYGQNNSPQPAAAPPQPEAPPPIPLTVVLRNGEQLQVQNYAVADNTFWAFAPRGARKIPLSSIDLAASAKATQANGGEFPQIGPAQ